MIDEENPKEEIEKDLFSQYGKKNIPKSQNYLIIPHAFKEYKKVTRESLKEEYNLIISNEQARDLIFYGVECKLSPKEFFIVKYLLANGFFDNKNFSEENFSYSKRVYDKDKKHYKKRKKEKALFSSTYNQLKDYKYKIKKKIRKKMNQQSKKQHLLINNENFEEKFNLLMYYVYIVRDFENPIKLYTLRSYFKNFSKFKSEIWDDEKSKKT